MKTAPGFAAILLLAIFATRANGSAGAVDDSWSLASPDGKLAATLALTAPGGAAGSPAESARLYYRIERGPEGGRREVLGWSPLGIVRDDQSFVDRLRLKAAGKVAAIDETYVLPHGKRRECRAVAREQTFAFANPGGAVVEVVLRVADRGVAIRYRFPGPGGQKRTVAGELTGFRLPAGARGWMTPYQEASQYTPAYEADYLSVAAGDPSPGAAGWAFPALFELPAGRWVLLTEAAVDGTYCGCRLAQKSPDGVYGIRFPDAAEGNGQGAVEPTSTLPWSTPWRVIMVADSPAGIVESTLVTDLNPPSRVEDISWIKPGRVAWSWWSDHDSPQDYGKMREFVDLAAEMGWEYFLVDANWTLMDHGNVRELARYARSKGVGLFLWYNSGGEHNVVTEKPRGSMKERAVRRFEFELLRKWGVKGVKVDFFQSDKQNIMALYHDILRDAADYHIMVNFHGCTVPRGWERTWPHLMSMEAVRGEECYTFAGDYPAKASAYNTVLCFTRNAVGPMDYTPCAFSDDRYPHLTTSAHELALSVLFESGLVHFADRVSAYRQLPEAAKDLLRGVPVAWDETRYVAGQPGQSAVLARRKGPDWYVAAINGRDKPDKVAVPLEFLGGGTFEATVIGDGENPRSFGARSFTVRAGDEIALALRPFGGAVIELSPRP